MPRKRPTPTRKLEFHLFYELSKVNRQIKRLTAEKTTTKDQTK
jgi:hypothetical protein